MTNHRTSAAVLAQLQAHPQGISMAAIAEVTHRSPGQVGVWLRRLRDDGRAIVLGIACYSVWTLTENRAQTEASVAAAKAQRCSDEKTSLRQAKYERHSQRRGKQHYAWPQNNSYTPPARVRSVFELGEVQR